MRYGRKSRDTGFPLDPVGGSPGKREIFQDSGKGRKNGGGRPPRRLEVSGAAGG
jgi:hypothetical protein